MNKKSSDTFVVLRYYFLTALSWLRLGMLLSIQQTYTDTETVVKIQTGSENVPYASHNFTSNGNSPSEFLKYYRLVCVPFQAQSAVCVKSKSMSVQKKYSVIA